MRDRFAALAGSLSMERRSGAFAFGSLQEGRHFLARNNAPMVAIRAMLPPELDHRLVGEVVALLEEFNRGSDRRVVVELEYLLVLLPARQRATRARRNGLSFGVAGRARSGYHVTGMGRAIGR